MPRESLLVVLYALMYVLALIITVTGFMLLRFVRRARAAKNVVLVEAKVVEIIPFVPGETDKPQKAGGREQYCPVFEALHEGQTLRFRGNPYTGTAQWIAGETVSLLINTAEGTAVEWDKIRISRIIGYAFVGLGLCIAVGALVFQISGAMR